MTCHFQNKGYKKAEGFFFFFKPSVSKCDFFFWFGFVLYRRCLQCAQETWPSVSGLAVHRNHPGLRTASSRPCGKKLPEEKKACPLQRLQRNIRENKVHKHLATEDSLLCLHKTHKRRTNVLKIVYMRQHCVFASRDC